MKKMRLGKLVLIGGLGFSAVNMPLLAAEEIPSRAVYVVYDDSGSMYSGGGQARDRWSYAKYAMEVFASMLNEKDQMNVYYMSDYSKDGPADGPRMELSGSSLPQKNVEKIHEEMTVSGWTPFETVEAAASDLEKSDADEKWLVVLTDGDFQKDGDVLDEKDQVTEFMDDFFEKKEKDINVTFLAIGNEVVPITEDEEDHVYFERAENSSQILGKLTDISNRIFNMNRIEVPVKTGEFTIDVPMSEITVFTQGNGSAVTGLVDGSGKPAGTMESPVKVSATESSDNPSYKDNVPVRDLQGELVTFSGEFEPGTYKVQAENAQILETFYKPDLDVAAYLTTATGDRIDDFSELPAGDYQIHFELISGIDGSPLPEHNMIERSEDGVSYKAVVRNNGKELDRTFDNGDTITLQQGSMDIDVTAEFLKYNTVTTSLNYSVWNKKTVEFKERDSDAGWKLGEKLEAESPLVVHMTVEGKEPSSGEWNMMKVPTASAKSKNGLELDPPLVEKGDTPGELLIYPNVEQKEFRKRTYEDAVITLTMDEEVNSIPWKGKKEITVPVTDARPFWVRWQETFMQNIGWFLLILLLIGVLIGELVKKRLPKMPGQINIESMPKNRRKGKRQNVRGYVEKNLLSCFIPFVPETGTITIVSKEADDISCPRKMEVKGAGSGKMEITNLSKFKNAETRVSIDGENLDQFEGTLRIGRSAEIVVYGDENTYTTVLSDKYVPEEE